MFKDFETDAIGHCIGIVVLGFSLTGLAQAKPVELSTDRLLVPQGFDDNDLVEVVLDGWLDSPCDDVNPPTVSVYPEQRVIAVVLEAQHQETRCMSVMKRFSIVAELGRLAAGDWEIITNNGWLVEPLLIQEANAAGINDFQYAQIDAASMDFAPAAEASAASRLSVVLTGRFTESCQTWDFIKVQHNDDVFEVLPVIRQDGSECHPQSRPFTVREFVPEVDVSQRHLLHVRSMNQASLNVVFGG